MKGTVFLLKPTTEPFFLYYVGKVRAREREYELEIPISDVKTRRNRYANQVLPPA